MSEPINSTIAPWMPEQDQLRLAALGKLVEEAAELAGRAARCIIQGIDEIDPDSGRTNRAELEREIADVQACIEMLGDAMPTMMTMPERQADKVIGFRRWHQMILERQP